VYLWCIQLDQSMSCLKEAQQTLAEDEQTRAERFVFPQHRDRFIVTRALLRTILSRYLQVAPHSLRFTYEAYGKPILAEPAQQHLCFNLSHSETLVLCAVSRQRALGVDIEIVRPLADLLALAQNVFTAREYATLCALSLSQQTEAFFHGWTRKEAFIKAIGAGLSYPLQGFEVSLAPNDPCQLRHIAGDTNAAAQWMLINLTPVSGYVGAVAVQGIDLRFVCWQWPLASIHFHTSSLL
jgi:4'-phosphopantetheinyl transferase